VKYGLKGIVVKDVGSFQIPWKMDGMTYQNVASPF